MNLILWFSYPFVQKAFIAGVMLAVIAGILGVLMQIRRSTFFGEAIAHSALAGVALAFLWGINPLIGALVYAGLFSMAIPVLQKTSKLSTDTILGILFPFSMGLGVIVFSLLPAAQPQLMSYLFGNMLMINISDLWILLVILLLLLLLLTLYFKQWLLISLDREYAQLLKIKVGTHDLLYHIFLALVVIIGVRLVGVILVTTLLVVPVSIARLFAKSAKQVFILSPIIGIFIMVFGLMLSIFKPRMILYLTAIAAQLTFIFTLSYSYFY